MPEGPTLILLREEASVFKGKIITGLGGYAGLDGKTIVKQKITEFRTWGKHFLICLQNRQSIRIHFMLFGSYLINQRKNTKPRLQLQFKKGEMNFYMCSVKLLTEDLNELYNWQVDIMGSQWNEQAACLKMIEQKDALICDVLLDQDIFAGVGNIIKNEVLYRTGVHPLSRVGAIRKQKIMQIVKEARKFSFEFLELKRTGILNLHLQVHKKTTCPKHGIPLTIKVLGKTKRKAYYCERCQMLYV